MKNVSFLLLFLFLYISAFSQFKYASSNYEKGSVEFNNGDVLDGFIILKVNSDINFKKSLEEKKKIKYKSKDIKFLSIGDSDYFYKTVKKGASNDIKALQISVKGDVVLYKEYIDRNTSAPLSGNITYDVNIPKEEVHYYLGRKGQKEVIYLKFGNSYSNKFEEIANQYFGNCASLINKIENREFDRFDLPGIVNYYNNDCK